MNILFKIQEAIATGLKNLFDITIQAEQVKIERTIADYEGDYTFVVFPFVKQARKSPEQTASALGDFLMNQNTLIAKYSIVKGFLNLTLQDTLLLNFFIESKGNATYLENQTGHQQKIMVEYSSPNTNKPLHLGHIRNIFLGYSLGEILIANGYDVCKVNLVNDRGIHICKSMLAWQQSGSNETPQSSGIKGDHLVGNYYVLFDKKYKEEIEQLIKEGKTKEEAEKQAPSIVQAQKMLQQWEAGDEEVVNLWRTMNGWVYAGFDQTYKRLGVDFNKYYYESETYLLGKSIIKEGLESGAFYQKPDGSVWIDLSEHGMDHKLLLRSDGTSVYISQDIGTAELKYHDFKYDKSLYVVGNEQDYHFKVLHYILKKLNKPYADSIYHVSYGMVDLPQGKMKSREGTVVDADDLMDEMHKEARNIILERGKTEGMDEEQVEELCEQVGMAGLKYYLLRVDPQKRLLFNPSESIDLEGNTGPYIQYTNARINSVLEKAGVKIKPDNERNLQGLPTLEQHDIPEHNANFQQQRDLEGFLTIEGLHPQERKLILAIYQYQDTLIKAAATYNPAEIANYMYDLAKLFNRFYYDCPIAKENVPENIKAFRLALCQFTGTIISECLRLLGIQAPVKM